MADITAKLSQLNPFAGKRREDDEDKGENIEIDSTGHRLQDRATQKDDLRVSSALRSFITANGILPEREVASDESGTPSPAMHALVTKPHISVPKEVTDPSHPLPEYFISSSHNTYLLAHQLYGTSCVSGYETALKTGSRCVEIDAWDNDDNLDEPKVTHGFTLVSNILFRAVCETIRDCYDQEHAAAQANPQLRPSPILISLENHCGARGQLRLAEIMREVFGHRLLSEPVRKEGHREQANSGEHITLEELGAKIVIMVEYHLPNEASDSDSSSDDSEDDQEDKAARKEYKDKKKQVPSTVIIPELSELGVYAQSVKPGDNSWFSSDRLVNGPHHHLINLSESGLASHLPENCVAISKHNTRHLMRVFPKGARISSSNLKPVPFWGIGAQVCALNWQTFGTSNQLNDALFAGSNGFVLKPAALRAGGDGSLSTGRKRRLRLHIAGASDIHLPGDVEAGSFKPYVTCSLFHPADLKNGPPKRKTAPYKQHKLGFLHRGENPPPTDPIWDEVLDWEYDDNELVFLRILIKHDESWGKNPNIAAHAVRLSYVIPGWSFIRMLDMNGRETRTSLLVRFEFEDV